MQVGALVQFFPKSVPQYIADLNVGFFNNKGPVGEIINNGAKNCNIRQILIESPGLHIMCSISVSVFTCFNVSCISRSFPLLGCGCRDPFISYLLHIFCAGSGGVRMSTILGL